MFQIDCDSLMIYNSTVLIVLSHLGNDHARRVVDEYTSPLDYIFHDTYFCTTFTTDLLSRVLE